MGQQAFKELIFVLRFSCDQNRCQSGLSAVRVKACPAPPLDLFLWKMDRNEGTIGALFLERSALYVPF
jgi:hypothetical protein